MSRVFSVLMLVFVIIFPDLMWSSCDCNPSSSCCDHCSPCLAFINQKSTAVCTVAVYAVPSHRVHVSRTVGATRVTLNSALVSRSTGLVRYATRAYSWWRGGKNYQRNLVGTGTMLVLCVCMHARVWVYVGMLVIFQSVKGHWDKQ